MTLTKEQLEFRSKIYGAIGWTGLALILLWYILKSTGFISTPLWIELLPMAIAVFTAGAFVQRLCSDIVTLKVGVNNLKTDVRGLKDRVGHLEKDMHYVKAQV